MHVLFVTTVAISQPDEIPLTCGWEDASQVASKPDPRRSHDRVRAQGLEMLNIGRLVATSFDYYLNKVARSQEEYYTGSGEAPGRWLGSEATRVGLAGVVPEEGLRRLLAGQHPTTGTALAERPDARRVAGFDLTFRAPKSVSLLYALAGSEVARTVVAAHDYAIGQALGYLERKATWTRRGHAGRERVRGVGLLAAGYQHRTSRAGDPLLHTHVLVANLTEGPDGRWTTLDSRSLYRHAKTASHLYQAALRHELTRTLGVAWQPPVRGHADLAGIPRKVIEAFSTRRRQILAHLAAHGHEPTARAAQVATLATRPAKPAHLPEPTLRARWQAQAARLGFGSRQLHAVLRSGHGRYWRAWRPGRPAKFGPALPDLDELAAVLAGPAGLTATASTFTRREVIQAICERLPTGAPADQVEALADRLLARPGLFVPVRTGPADPNTDPNTGPAIGAHDPTGTPDDPADRRPAPSRGELQREPRPEPRPDLDGEPAWTTPGLLQVEADLLTTATRRQGDGVGLVDEPTVAATVARFTLEPDQAAMLRQLTRAGHGVQVVNAGPGTGKTHTLNACRHAWQHAGYHVYGAALAATAARGLGRAAHLDHTTTLARLLRRLDAGNPLPPRSVVLVDEAGMVGTRALAYLARNADTAGAKLVLVGDTDQLPEIEVGGAFAALARRLGAIELSRNRRQAHPWERVALDAFRAGDVETALAAYQAHQRLLVEPTEEVIRARLVADWWHAHRHRTAGEPEPVMLAATRAEVADLNSRARAHLAAAGRLGPDLLELDGRPFAVGDRVVCLRNDYRLDVINGDRATVTAIDPERAALTVRLDDDGRQVELPTGYLLGPEGWQVDHAYALTGHKAQGMTGGRMFILAGEGLYREWAYVALSRGRLDNRLYVAEDLARDLDVDLDQPRQPARDVPAFLTRALGDSRAKTLALDRQQHQQLDTSLGIEL